MTNFETVYNKFLTSVSDYDFLLMDDDVYLEKMLRNLLDSAAADFVVCTKDLSDTDEEALCFNVDLSRQEIEILATGMAVHWLEPKVLNSDNLRNALNTKDYTTFSPAKLLEQLIVLRDQLDRKFVAAMNLYSYRNGEIENLAE